MTSVECIKFYRKKRKLFFRIFSVFCGLTGIPENNTKLCTTYRLLWSMFATTGTDKGGAFEFSGGLYYQALNTHYSSMRYGIICVNLFYFTLIQHSGNEVQSWNEQKSCCKRAWNTHIRVSNPVRSIKELLLFMRLCFS